MHRTACSSSGSQEGVTRILFTLHRQWQKIVKENCSPALATRFASCYDDAVSHQIP